MKKIAKLFSILGAIASRVGFVTIIVVLIYDYSHSYGYLEESLRLRLYTAAIYIFLIGILGIVSLFVKTASKGLSIGGIVVCFIGLYQTYGVAVLALVGFVLTLIDISNQEKEREKEIEALPEAERIFVQNNDINFRYRHVDYKSYVSKHLPSYIVSIMLSVIFISFYVFGVVLFTMNIYDKWNVKNVGLAIFGIFILAFIIYGILLIFFVWMLSGLLVSILAITSPNRKILKINSVMGFVCLTFFNAIASIDILNEIDRNIKSSIRYPNVDNHEN